MGLDGHTHSSAEEGGPNSDSPTYDADGLIEPEMWGEKQEAAFQLQNFADSFMMRICFMGLFTVIGFVLIAFDECLLWMAGLVSSASTLWIAAHLIAVWRHTDDPSAARATCEVLHTTTMVAFGLLSIIGGQLAHKGTTPSLSGAQCPRAHFAERTFGLWNLIHEPAHLTIGFITCAYAPSAHHLIISTISFEGGIAVAYARAYYGASPGSAADASWFNQLVTIGIVAELASYLFGCAMGLALVTLQRRQAVKSLRIEQLQTERIEQLAREKERLAYDTQIKGLRHVFYTDPSVAPDDEYADGGHVAHGARLAEQQPADDDHEYCQALPPRAAALLAAATASPCSSKSPPCDEARASASKAYCSSFGGSSAATSSELGDIFSPPSESGSSTGGRTAALYHPNKPATSGVVRLTPPPPTPPATSSSMPGAERPASNGSNDSNGSTGKTKMRAESRAESRAAVCAAADARTKEVTPDSATTKEVLYASGAMSSIAPWSKRPLWRACKPAPSSGCSSTGSVLSEPPADVEGGWQTPGEPRMCGERDAALSRTLKEIGL